MAALMKKTRIIATIGPASQNPETIRRLIRAGVNAFRLNFSHGDHATHGRSMAMIKQVSDRCNTPVALVADLQGPKIRTRCTEGNRPVMLKKGARIAVTGAKVECGKTLVAIDYPDLEKEIKPGQKIMINDGAIRLTTLSADKKARRIMCLVEAGGTYGSHKGVNLPDVKLSLPSLTSKDLSDLSFILRHDIQYLALSFVRSAADVLALRARVRSKRPGIRIIAKIEKPEAAAAIDSILDAADGIMVARGDLGVETTPSDVPVLQKTLISRANEQGKTVIVATQMLESMIEHPLPTRAESSDVANAIFDGADAIMLSGETAVGAFPLEAAAMMARIARTAEQSQYLHRDIINLSGTGRRSSRAVCEAAAWASRDLDNSPVCVFTLSGDTALYMSKIRNQSPIFAFSPEQKVVRMLSLAWNVTPFHIPFEKHMADLITDAESILLRNRLVRRGAHIILVSGTTPVKGATNVMRIKRVGER
ncbi:MAG: pyruvate kinase [Chitinispirillaceae bacterium]|nr:pyruvate kinase [Chitinispirillaceae bacterium]